MTFKLCLEHIHSHQQELKLLSEILTVLIVIQKHLLKFHQIQCETKLTDTKKFLQKCKNKLLN